MKNFSGQTFCFLGRSGAGKDSQVNFLKDFLSQQGCKILSISTGDEGRKLIAKNTAVGRWIKEILDAGNFFPDWMAISLWLCAVQNELNSEDVLLFSGSPRKIFEAQVLDDLCNGTHRPLPIPIHLNINEDEARRRLLKRGRSDDTLEVINNRLFYFNSQVLPIINFYGNRVIEVDGTGTKEEVNQRMMNELLK